MSGGVGPFDYTFTAAGAGGAGSFNPTSPQIGITDDLTTVWTAPAAGASPEYYSIIVDVTDQQTAVTIRDAVWIEVRP